MAAGQLVFPVLMGIVILFVSAYVVATPATPAPEDPAQRLIRVEPGDQVLLEVTGYYGEPGSGRVFFSTQEERHDSLPRGELQPQLQQNPVTYNMLPESGEEPQGLDAALLGKRPGDVFTTPRIGPAFGFGDWEEDLTLPRAVATLPIRVELNSQTLGQAGRPFNASQYVDAFEDEGFDLEVGAVWPCDGEELWDCRLLELDEANNRLRYERIIEDGAAYPIRQIIDANTVGGTQWNFTVRNVAGQEQFQLLLDPPAGTIFQLRQDLRDPYHAGTYHVQSVTADNLVVRYSSESEANPALVGKPVYYEIEILRILRG